MFAYNQKYYSEHKEEVCNNQKSRRPSIVALRHAKRDWMHEILGGVCTNCGGSEGLDVHHPHGKDVPLTWNHSWAKIEDEAMVTILLCSACHRKHHKEELNDAM